MAIKVAGTIVIDDSRNVSNLGSALTVVNGGTGLGTVNAYGILTGGTTSSGAFQQVPGTGTSGQILTSNGPAALPTWQTSSGGGANVQSFSATGTYTKPSGTKFVYVELWGAGGSGYTGGIRTRWYYATCYFQTFATGGTTPAGPTQGNRAAGGGGGAYTYKMFAAPQVGSTETVTVGAGGPVSPKTFASPCKPQGGTAGGTTNFGTLLYAQGGQTDGLGGSAIFPFVNNYETYPNSVGGSPTSTFAIFNPSPFTNTLGIWAGGSSQPGPRTGANSAFSGAGGGYSSLASDVDPTNPTTPTTQGFPAPVAPAASPTLFGVSYPQLAAVRDGGRGGQGRLFGAPPSLVNPTAMGVAGGIVSTTFGTAPPAPQTAASGSDFQGGGGGAGVSEGTQPSPISNRTLSARDGGNGGLASGGGGGGFLYWCGVLSGPYSPKSPLVGAGGSGGNGYAIVYSWA